MHTVQLLDQAIAAARQLGIQIRQDWLGGEGSCTYELKKEQWVFLDLGQSPQEHLSVVLEALQLDPRTVNLRFPEPLQNQLRLRKSA